VTQESLRSAIAVVPQDISLFSPLDMENIRYRPAEASDCRGVRSDRGGELQRVHQGAAGRRREPSSATAG
jgi:ABC-type transport system involved in Fe-S cluster assembly fused permease/ATPase subunit